MTRIKSQAISEASARNAATRQRDARGHFLPRNDHAGAGAQAAALAADHASASGADPAGPPAPAAAQEAPPSARPKDRLLQRLFRSR